MFVADTESDSDTAVPESKVDLPESEATGEPGGRYATSRTSSLRGSPLSGLQNCITGILNSWGFGFLVLWLFENKVFLGLAELMQSSKCEKWSSNQDETALPPSFLLPKSASDFCYVESATVQQNLAHHHLVLASLVDQPSL